VSNTTILRVVSGSKHPAFGEVSRSGKKLSEFDKRLTAKAFGATAERPITVPSLRDSLIFPTYPGLTPWANIVSPCRARFLRESFRQPTQNEYSHRLSRLS
jgi:hypothetical protein